MDPQYINVYQLAYTDSTGTSCLQYNQSTNTVTEGSCKSADGFTTNPSTLFTSMYPKPAASATNTPLDIRPVQAPLYCVQPAAAAVSDTGQPPVQNTVVGPCPAYSTTTYGGGPAPWYYNITNGSGQITNAPASAINNLSLVMNSSAVQTTTGVYGGWAMQYQYTNPTNGTTLQQCNASNPCPNNMQCTSSNVCMPSSGYTVYNSTQSASNTSTTYSSNNSSPSLNALIYTVPAQYIQSAGASVQINGSIYNVQGQPFQAPVTMNLTFGVHNYVFTVPVSQLSTGSFSHTWMLDALSIDQMQLVPGQSVAITVMGQPTASGSAGWVKLLNTNTTINFAYSTVAQVTSAPTAPPTTPAPTSPPSISSTPTVTVTASATSIPTTTAPVTTTKAPSGLSTATTTPANTSNNTSTSTMTPAATPTPTPTASSGMSPTLIPLPASNTGATTFAMAFIGLTTLGIVSIVVYNVVIEKKSL